MKNLLILSLITISSFISFGCTNFQVQQDSFRVKTRGKIHLYGMPIPLSVPNKNVSIRLRTPTVPGTEGTTGTINEFEPSGLYVSTGEKGEFDAVNAVMPAVWNVRVAPEQSQCGTPLANPYFFSVSAGSSHNIECQWNVQINFQVQPNAIAIGHGNHPPNYTSTKSMTGILVKSIDGSPYYKRLNSSQLKVLYYKQISGEDYELEGEKPILSVSPNGEDIVIPVPNYNINRGIVHYRILIKEVTESVEVYVGHSELNVSYGF